MQTNQTNLFLKYILPGVLISAAFTAVIGLTAANLSGFQIVGRTVPFAYPWRLTEPNAMARLTAWTGYLLHNLIAWSVLFLAQREKPKFGNDLRWFNWAMIATTLVFIVLHIFQTQLFYDGLARDVPEVTAQGSVAIMLMIIIIFETPRRGLIFGRLPDVIFVCSSSRTVSFIMAPQAGQIDKVGAKLRSHTGQFIRQSLADLELGYGP